VRLRFDYGFDDVEKKDVMVSYSGAVPIRFYSTERQATHNITGGLMLGWISNCEEIFEELLKEKHTAIKPK